MGTVAKPPDQSSQPETLTEPCIMQLDPPLPLLYCQHHPAGFLNGLQNAELLSNLQEGFEILTSEKLGVLGTL